MRAFLASLCVLAVAVWATDKRPAAAQKPEADLTKLIDELAEVSQVGFGYSARFSGSQFLPLPDSERVGTLVIGSAPARQSSVLEQIVRRGARAIPALLKRLDDGRKTRIPPVRGLEWTMFTDRLDYNRRTQKEPAVNQEEKAPEKPAAPCDELACQAAEQKKEPDPLRLFEPPSHHLTVGDLCYVALGQIVNRQFNASRHQPSGGVVVTSPTYSKRLREAVRAAFKDLTEEKHKHFLRSDFESPDHEYRRIGAYLRLAFYYPNEVEELVLKQLAVPVYDELAVEAFVRETLYPKASDEERRAAFKRFVAKHGKVSADGILIQLFDDLGTQEADEEGRLHPPREEKDKHDARTQLVTIYGYPKKVKSSDAPYVSTWGAAEQARFVKALVHDKSPKVDAAVFELLRNAGADDYLGWACLARLKGRFADEKLQPYVPKEKSRRGGSGF